MFVSISIFFQILDRLDMGKSTCFYTFIKIRLIQLKQHQPSLLFSFYLYLRLGLFELHPFFKNSLPINFGLIFRILRTFECLINFSIISIYIHFCISTEKIESHQLFTNHVQVEFDISHFQSQTFSIFPESICTSNPILFDHQWIIIYYHMLQKQAIVFCSASKLILDSWQQSYCTYYEILNYLQYYQFIIAFLQYLMDCNLQSNIFINLTLALILTDLQLYDQSSRMMIYLLLMIDIFFILIYLFMRIIIILVIFGLLYGTNSQFQPAWKVVPPNSPIQMVFTIDQKYLAISNDSSIYIYEAQLGKTVQKLNLDRNGLVSFAFNSDSTWLATGFTDSEVRLYNYQDGQFVYSNKTYQNTTLITSVKSMCFTSDSSYLIFGLYQDLFVVWNLQTDQTLVSSFKNQFVFTVSCSPIKSNFFAVGGGTNTLSKFTFYNFESDSITQFHDVQNLLNDTAQASTFNIDGSHIYIAQKNGKIAKYDTTNFNKQSIDIPSLVNKSLTTIVVSKNQRLIATAFAGKVVVITFTSSFLGYTAQLFDSQTPSVALSPQGGHVSYISLAGEGLVAGQCPVGQYSDNNGGCLNCTTQCYYCDGSPDLCYMCNSGYYIDNHLCSPCSLACKTCESDTQCTQCVNQQLVVKDGFCQCIDSASYIDTNLNCISCNTTLQFCVQCTNGSVCLVCQEGMNRIVQDGQCVCDTGYYSDANNVCQLCTILVGCLQCSSSSICTKCDDIQNWQLNEETNTCGCRMHFYQNNMTCQSCITGCATCQDSTTCITCAASEHWQNNETSCVCSAAYYQLDQLCQSCMTGCLQCTQLQLCQLCNTTAHFYSDNGVCKCPQGYYVGLTECLTCNVSIAHCSTCSQDGKVCSQCFGQIKLVNNKCVCDRGKWPNVTLCSNCPEGCKECDDFDNCTSCQSGYDLDGNVCRKNGIDTLIIVIIIVGVIILTGAIFVVVKCIKKRRSPLQNDDYQQL